MKESLGWEWYRRGDEVLCGRGEISGADVATFRALNGIWAKDNERVYCAGEPVRKADPASFRVLNWLFAKDDRHVFFLQGIVKGADAGTFEALGPAVDTGNSHGFARDKHGVWSYSLDEGKPKLLRGSDGPSFEVLENGFGKDRNYVYFEHARLKGANPASWQLFKNGYSRDGRKVWSGHELFKEADGETFEVLPSDDSDFARDRDHYFCRENLATKQEFFHEFGELFIMFGVVKEAVAIDKRGNAMPGATVADAECEQGFQLTVECREWLQRPPSRIRSPDVGGTWQVKHHSSYLDVDNWRERESFWLLVADNDRRILTPIMAWREFASSENRELLQSLVDESAKLQDREE